MDLVCIDGELIEPGQARISVTDDGFLRGDGVFEVMRLYGGTPFARDRHLERMARSATNLRLAFDPQAMRADIELLLEAARPDSAVLRVIVTRGGRRVTLLEPLPELPGALSLGYVTYSPTRVLDGIKSLSYAANMLAGRLAAERGFDEALLVTPHRRVLECPTASFFWARGGELFTPPLGEHLLDSITRRIVVEEAGAQERETQLADVEQADEAFIASSVREVVAVGRVEQHELDAPGSLTRAAAAAVSARIQAEL